MLVNIAGIRVSLEEGEGELKKRLAEIFALPPETISLCKILRKTLDARRHRPPFFIYTVEVALPDDIRLPDTDTGELKISLPATSVASSAQKDFFPAPGTALRAGKMPRVVVVGSGPAGLFASLRLAERGIPVLLLERGSAIPARCREVQAFWEEGLLQRESNVHFGEGGAGTFSDGKLTSRSKNPLTGLVKATFVALGAPADILSAAKPHIGTDKLREVVVNFRHKLLALGCEIRFGAHCSGLRRHNGRIVGLSINETEEVPADYLILAMGQHADDTYGMLHGQGVQMVPKPFAMGLRLEHPQILINQMQYGKWHRHPALPPAEYFLTARTRLPERSVYTFCMCPGGRVIGCSSETGGVITNGMSGSAREGAYGNSAVVVNVNPADFAGTPQEPLRGLKFRRHWEEQAFVLGGKNYFAPAQRLTDFMQGRASDRLMPVSFRPGVQAAPLAEALPAFAGAALREGLQEFGLKIPEFFAPEAMLIGVETRTSAPVRVLRDTDGQSVNTAGLYPCGEGAGYAGGIVSSALDGIRAADSLIRSLDERQ